MYWFGMRATEDCRWNLIITTMWHHQANSNCFPEVVISDLLVCLDHSSNHVRSRIWHSRKPEKKQDFTEHGRLSAARPGRVIVHFFLTTFTVHHRVMSIRERDEDTTPEERNLTPPLLYELKADWAFVPNDWSNHERRMVLRDQILSITNRPNFSFSSNALFVHLWLLDSLCHFVIASLLHCEVVPPVNLMSLDHPFLFLMEMNSVGPDKKHWRSRLSRRLQALLPQGHVFPDYPVIPGVLHTFRFFSRQGVCWSEILLRSHTKGHPTRSAVHVLVTSSCSNVFLRIFIHVFHLLNSSWFASTTTCSIHNVLNECWIKLKNSVLNFPLLTGMYFQHTTHTCTVHFPCTPFDLVLVWIFCLIASLQRLSADTQIALESANCFQLTDEILRTGVRTFFLSCRHVLSLHTTRK